MAAMRVLLLLAAIPVSSMASAGDPAIAQAKRWTGLLKFNTKLLASAALQEDNPVKKVVGLLEEMQAQLKKEKDEDADAYDKMQCWCENGEELKTRSIAAAKKRMVDLVPDIEENQAKGAALATDIKALREAIASNERALKEAQALRYKEKEEFMQEERDVEDTIRGSKMALKVLATNHDAALPQEAMLQVRQVLRKHKVFDPAQLEKVGLTTSERKLVMALVDKNPHLQEYSAKSGPLVGMLNTMLGGFQENLVTLQAEEANNAKGFEELKPAKEQEIRAASTSLRQKQIAKVKADDEANSALVEQKQTETGLKADQRALVEIRERCPKMDQEFAERNKLRDQETIAIGEAIKILSDDDARDAMHHVTTFAQVAMQRHKAVKDQHRDRTAVLKIINGLAAKGPNAQMALLALAAKNDVFAAVKESIDKMIDQLDQTERDELKQRDYCNEELHQNTLQMDEKYHDKDQQLANIEENESVIARTTEELKVLRKEIADSQIEMKQAFEARQEENADFRLILADQLAAKETLQKALKRLEIFYNVKPEMLQGAQKKGIKETSRWDTEAKDHDKVMQLDSANPEFDTYNKQSGGASAVQTMLKQIISETEEQMVQTGFTEYESQLGHETYGRECNKILQMRFQQVAAKTEQKAQADEDLANTKADLKVTQNDLAELHDYLNGVHRECDFVLVNFQKRRDARKEEVTALEEAKAMMSGMAVPP